MVLLSFSIHHKLPSTKSNIITCIICIIVVNSSNILFNQLILNTVKRPLESTTFISHLCILSNFKLTLLDSPLRNTVPLRTSCQSSELAGRTNRAVTWYGELLRILHCLMPCSQFATHLRPSANSWLISPFLFPP